MSREEVLDGTLVSDAQYSGVVNFEIDGELCSGVMLTNTTFLTAQHCGVYEAITSDGWWDSPQTVTVYMGNVDTTGAPSYSRTVTWARNAPNTPEGKSVDVTIVRVDSPFEIRNASGNKVTSGYRKPLYPGNHKPMSLMCMGYGMSTDDNVSNTGRGVLRSSSLVSVVYSEDPSLLYLTSSSKMIFHGDSGGPCFDKEGSADCGLGGCIVGINKHVKQKSDGSWEGFLTAARTIDALVRENVPALDPGKAEPTDKDKKLKGSAGDGGTSGLMAAMAASGPVTVEFWTGSTLMGTVVANQPTPDGRNNGFEFEIPTAYRTGYPIEVKAIVRDDENRLLLHLAGSPMTLVAGTPLGSDTIQRKYEAMLDARGPLGPTLPSPMGDERESPDGDGRLRHYSYGAIYWHSRAQQPAFAVYGAIYNRYESMGGVQSRLGWPTADVKSDSTGGLYGVFQNGRLYHHPSTGTFALYDEKVISLYQQSGGGASPEGYPIADEVVDSRGGARVLTQNGALVHKAAATNAFGIRGPIFQRWFSEGAENNRLGYPIAVQGGSGGAYGFSQEFENGYLLHYDGTGTRAIYTKAIFTSWASYRTGTYNSYPGGGGIYIPPVFDAGRPIADERAAANGGTMVEFEYGAFYWSASTGARPVKNGPFRTLWEQRGAEGGGLGYPTQYSSSAGNGYTRQPFQGGYIYYSDATGPIVLINSIRIHHDNLGGNSGGLGYPVSGGYTFGGGEYVRFQLGAIYWHPMVGAFEVHGDIYAKYNVMGQWQGLLSIPVSDELLDPATGGQMSKFLFGSIRWVPGKATEELGPYLTGHRFFPMDYDGDGDDDLVVRGPHGHFMAFQSEGGQISFAGVLANTNWADDGGWNSGHRFFVMDVDNDQDDDIVARDSFGTFHLLRSERTQFVMAGWMLQHPGMADQWGWNDGHRYFVMDINGDQKDDLLARDSAGTFYALRSNGTQLVDGGVVYADQGLADQWGWNAGHRYFPMDYDGDGDDDLVTRDSYGYFYGLRSERTHLVGAGLLYSNTGMADQLGWNDGNRYYVMNFDAQGGEDLLLHDSAGTFFILRGQSTGLVSGGVVLASSYGDGAGWGSGNRFFVMDFDKDGDDDLVGRTAYGSLIGFRSDRTALVHRGIIVETPLVDGPRIPVAPDPCDEDPSSCVDPCEEDPSLCGPDICETRPWLCDPDPYE